MAAHICIFAHISAPLASFFSSGVYIWIKSLDWRLSAGFFYSIIFCSRILFLLIGQRMFGWAVREKVEVKWLLAAICILTWSHNFRLPLNLIFWVEANSDGIWRRNVWDCQRVEVGLRNGVADELIKFPFVTVYFLGGRWHVLPHSALEAGAKGEPWPITSV